MPCYSPVTMKSVHGLDVTVPCGQCIGCRLGRSQDWALRLAHEASLHAESSFLTLTYSSEHLPSDLSLNPTHMKLFMYRLRKHLQKPPAIRVRFYLCGEYGSKGCRPHYHILLFGFGFPDKVLHRRTSAGYLTYTSPTLERLWPYGLSEIGTVTSESAGYVARYVTKKVTGSRATEHYRRVNPETGEVWQVHPEFARMSNRPGIGLGWLRKYPGDVFPRDFITTVDGKKRPVPRYYKKKLTEDQQWELTVKRFAAAWKRRDNNTPERLLVREEVQLRKFDLLKREYEE